MTETMAYGYSSESTQRELSNEYQHDRVWMILNYLCDFVLWTEVASAMEVLIMQIFYSTSLPVLNRSSVAS